MTLPLSQNTKYKWDSNSLSQNEPERLKAHRARMAQDPMRLKKKVRDKAGVLMHTLSKWDRNL